MNIKLYRWQGSWHMRWRIFESLQARCVARVIEWKDMVLFAICLSLSSGSMVFRWNHGSSELDFTFRFVIMIYKPSWTWTLRDTSQWHLIQSCCSAVKDTIAYPILHSSLYEAMNLWVVNLKHVKWFRYLQDIHCRIGIAQGTVIYGVLGHLQVNFIVHVNAPDI